MRLKQHEHIIALIQSALLNEQSQPWMYEVLALNMEICQRPPEEIERVVLSLTDFGAADFSSMMFSAAYLARLGREEAALRLYREASRFAQEQPEPYVLGLRLAQRTKNTDAIEWAALGVLRYVWTEDYQTAHRRAENALADRLQQLRSKRDADAVARLQARLADARRRDLIVELQWSGAGDLDLLVEDPSRFTVSFETPHSPGGGTLIRDGYGPLPENTIETYVCALGLPGEYRIRVRHAWGEIVGNRATLKITRHLGTESEKVETHTITLGPEDAVVRIELSAGRREALRPIADRQVSRLEQTGRMPRLPAKPANVQQAVAEFEASRRQQDAIRIRQVGAVGYQPIVQIIPDGSAMAAQAVVSPDRRYVRIGVMSQFSTITDVFTFSFIGGANAAALQPGVGN